MPKQISRIVILGDSISDIGNMHDRSVGRFATINKHGRFSDGRNWVDFLWEHVSSTTMFRTDEPAETCRRSREHLRLSAGSSSSSRLELVNYSEGGAVGMSGSANVAGTMNRFKEQKVLSHLEDLIAKYVSDLQDPSVSGRVPAAEVLHIVWIGINDLITIKREPGEMAEVARTIVKQTRALLSRPELRGSHCIFLDLPDLGSSPKFVKSDKAKLQRIAEGTRIFNETLREEVVEAAFDDIRAVIELLPISEILTPSILADEANVAPFHQAKGEDYPGAKVGRKRVEGAQLLANTDVGFDEESEFGADTDKLHPTSAVHDCVATHIIDYLENDDKTQFTWP